MISPMRLYLSFPTLSVFRRIRATDMLTLHEERFLNVLAGERLRRLRIPHPTSEQLAEMKDLIVHVWVRRTVHMDSRLTTREKECLFYIACDKKDKEIAAYMNVTENTVRTFRESILQKLGCKRMAAAIARGIQYGEIPAYKVNAFGEIIGLAES